MEGLYVKIEENGIVIERYKYMNILGMILYLRF